MKRVFLVFLTVLLAVGSLSAQKLERVCKTLTDNKITPFSGLLKENWPIGHFITMVHANLLAEKNISVSKFISDMDAEEMAWNEQQAAFANEKSAMMVQGLWSYGPAAASLMLSAAPIIVFYLALQK